MNITQGIFRARKLEIILFSRVRLCSPGHTLIRYHFKMAFLIAASWRKILLEIFHFSSLLFSLLHSFNRLLTYRKSLYNIVHIIEHSVCWVFVMCSGCKMKGHVKVSWCIIAPVNTGWFFMKRFLEKCSEEGDLCCVMSNQTLCFFPCSKMLSFALPCSS